MAAGALAPLAAAHPGIPKHAEALLSPPFAVAPLHLIPGGPGWPDDGDDGSTAGAVICPGGAAGVGAVPPWGA